MNARGFKQVEGQHYNGTNIISPVTNSATIRIVLTFMITVGMLAHVVDIKGAFLHGKFEDGEVIHMEVPQGFETHFPEGSVLWLKKCLHGLKQAAKAFRKQLLCAASAMGLTQSKDACVRPHSGIRLYVIKVNKDSMEEEDNNERNQTDNETTNDNKEASIGVGCFFVSSPNNCKGRGCTPEFSCVKKRRVLVPHTKETRNQIRQAG